MQRTLFFRIWAVVGFAAAVGLLIVFGPLLTIPLSFFLGGGAGVVLSRCLASVPEARRANFTQLVIVLGSLAASIYVSSFAGMVTLTCVLAGVGFIIMFLMRQVTNFGGTTFINLLDQQDWTPADEEIALRPIRQLVDRENYRQALGELDQILKTHKPTYEAVLLKAKLLNHIGRVPDAKTALLSLIGLSNSPAQQLAVMEMLASLDQDQPELPNAPTNGARRIEICHELILFQMPEGDPTSHKQIPPGSYEVQEIVHRNQRWLKLKGEDFGNAEICWNAILGQNRPVAQPAATGFFQRLARMGQSIKGKPRRQLLAESQSLFQEAKEYIRRDDWNKAVPILELAATLDPDHFEIAYRWATAVRQTADVATASAVLNRVLTQSQWTKTEQEMLQQLKPSK